MLSDLSTPISAEKLSLALTNYDPTLRAELVSGFSKGFQLGYFGFPRNNLIVKNSPSVSEFQKETLDHFQNELTAKRF